MSNRQAQVVLEFEAALVPSTRKALTLDADGEAVLTLVIPASDALRLWAEFPHLMNTSFHVRIACPKN